MSLEEFIYIRKIIINEIHLLNKDNNYGIGGIS